MTDKEKLQLRQRIERVKFDAKQRELIAGTEPLWAKYRLLNGLEGEARRNCVCVLDNQRGYNEFLDFPDSFRRISIPVVRRLFNEFQTPIQSRHEGYVNGKERVAVPPVVLELGDEFTDGLTAFAFIEDQYEYHPYQMLDRECEDSVVLVDRLARYLEGLSAEFNRQGYELFFLGIGWAEEKQQLLAYIDMERKD